MRPELTVGPDFVDGQLERSDLATEPTTGAITPGVPLMLVFAVSDVTSGQCRPLAGAMVDVWQCDVAGGYSGVCDGMIGFATQG